MKLIGLLAFSIIVDGTCALFYAGVIYLTLALGHHADPIIPTLGYGYCYLIALMITGWSIVSGFQSSVSKAIGEMNP